MSKQRGLGSLADLAKILEEASNPESDHREDKRETKPKTAQAVRKAGGAKQVRALDPKKKAWYERRLKEQTIAAHVAEDGEPEDKGPERLHTPGATRSAATKAGGSLLASLANVKDVKNKPAAGSKRSEAWRRKPGDPLF